MGGRSLESFERRLQIRKNHQGPQIQLERVACVGCSMAPVVVVDEKIEQRVTPTRVDGIMLALAEESDAEKREEEKEA